MRVASNEMDIHINDDPAARTARGARWRAAGILSKFLSTEHSGADTNRDSYTYRNADRDADRDFNTDTDSNRDSYGDSYRDRNGNTYSDADCDPDSDCDSYSNGDGHGDPNRDTDRDAHAGCCTMWLR